MSTLINLKCSKCKKALTDSEAYEYRGAIACYECFDQVCESRDYERSEIIREEDSKTKAFRGLDLGDNVIGKANREILKAKIEIASKESGRLKKYEGRS